LLRGVGHDRQREKGKGGILGDFQAASKGKSRCGGICFCAIDCQLNIFLA